MKVHYAIFDMDGTMFDTEDLFVRSYVEYVSKITGIKYDRESLYSILGATDQVFHDQWNILFGPGPSYEECRVYSRRWRAEWLEQNGFPIKPGLIEILDHCRKLGIRMAVASGTNTDKVINNCEKAAVYEYFDAFIGGDQVVNAKPHPESFVRAEKALGGIDPQEAVVFEDSYNGLLAAWNGGFKSIIIPDLYDPTIRYPGKYDLRVNTLAEAIPYIESLE